MDTAFKTIYWLLVLALLGVGILLIGTMAPIPGNIEVKIVKSGSMEPTLPIGSLVIVKPVESYELGNIITFGEDTKRQIPTTHRIVNIGKENGRTVFTTQGDANENPDQSVITQRDIIGKVVAHVPYAGFIIDFARQPKGFILLVVVPALFVILDEFLTIFVEMKRLRQPKLTSPQGHFVERSYEDVPEKKETRPLPPRSLSQVPKPREYKESLPRRIYQEQRVKTIVGANKAVARSPQSRPLFTDGIIRPVIKSTSSLKTC